MAVRGGGDDEEAPWLSAAEPDGRETYVSRRRFRIVAILLGALVLVVAALVYAVIARPQAHDDENGFAGDVPLIRAPEGPFRTRPENAGGMSVEGVGQTAYQAADGVDPEGQLALDQIPEEPMARPVAPRTSPPRAQVEPQARPAETRVMPAPIAPLTPVHAPEPTPKAEPLPQVKTPKQAAAPPPKVTESPRKTAPSGDRLADVLADVDKAAAKAPKKAPEADLPTVTSGGSGPAALQLGAFSSSAKADAAWKNFQHYSYLGGLTKSVVKVEREEGGAVYRLKATGVETREKAANLCARLKVAGEQCVVSE